VEQLPETARSRSSLGRAVGFVGRHPTGILHAAFLTLVAIVVFQNLEPTSIDVLFWSWTGVPKLFLILISMIVGAAAWEIARRLIRR